MINEIEPTKEFDLVQKLDVEDEVVRYYIVVDVVV